MINDTIGPKFFKTAISILVIQTITVYECCSIKLLLYIFFEKYVNILALEMASPVNQHCANCIVSYSESLATGFDRVQDQVECWLLA